MSDKSQEAILKWMTNRGYYLRHDKGLRSEEESYSLFFTDGGSGTRRISIWTGAYEWALQRAYESAQEDWGNRTPERFLSYLRDGEIVAQIPCTLRDEEAIEIDAFLRNLGKLNEDEEVATTEVMEKAPAARSSLDDPGLIQLVWSEDDHNAFTTFERMGRHLIRCHGINEADIWGKTQEEVERMHLGLHQMECDHSHPKPVVVCGHEPKGVS